MRKIRAILVDDEESARDVLSNLLARFCPEVELLEKCTNVESAVKAIHQHQPDVVFLDIEMPNYAGYEIVHFFDEVQFEIIFVTAYDSYALRAFEVSAVDYLLKPIDIERLTQAVSKVQQTVDLKQLAQRYSLLGETLQTNELKSIIVAEKGYQEIIQLADIVAIEAQESYSYIHTVSGKKYMASKHLKHFERVFEGQSVFLRVHKSWIINKTMVLNYSKTDLTINLETGISAKLSKYKKVEFEEAVLS
ncbi:MAG: response regulator transcription factor [Bacteroidota bacterium]